MKNLKKINNELYIGKYKLSDLGKEYQTPTYIFDEDDLDSKMKFYKDTFKSDNFKTSIVYASKAFLVPAICELLTKNDLCMDAMSITDMEIAKFAKYDFSKIVFHGNNKSDHELEYAIKNNVGYIVVDNLDELKRLNLIATNHQKEVNTLFRINPLVDAHTHKYIQTALNASKFGENINDEKIINLVLKTYQNSKYVKLLGFHSHIGSQIKEVEPFLLLVQKLVAFTKEINETYHMGLDTINLGGGFGIEYFKGDEKVDLDAMLKALICKIEDENKLNNMFIKHIMIEPGRSIVGPACLTLYECGILKKTIGGKNFLFIDGGMTDNIRPALYDAKYQAVVVDKVESNQLVNCDIVGKCCESGDFIIKDATIPVTKPKDYIAIFQTGAYNYSMHIEYNGHLRPQVLFVGDKVRVVSKRQTVEHVLELFK